MQKRVVADRILSHEDMITGEVFSQDREQVYLRDNGIPFAKEYMWDIEYFPVTRSIKHAFIACIKQMMTFSNGPDEFSYFMVNKETKAEIARICGVGVDMVKYNVRACLDGGILFKSGMRGRYIVNPYFFGKGTAQTMRALQKHFAFIDGKWYMDIQGGNQDD